MFCITLVGYIQKKKCYLLLSLVQIWKNFNVGTMGGTCNFWIFRGSGEVSKKGEVDFLREGEEGGGPEDFLRIICNCWSNIT